MSVWLFMSPTDSPGMSSGLSSCAVCAPSTVFTGALFTGATVSVTVAVLEPTAPSLAVKVKLSVPLKSGFGV